MMASDNIPSVLFVCYANICRSPTAEAVFRKMAADAGLQCKIDSAGTHGSFGQSPDKRSVQVASAKGYHFEGIHSRKVSAEDLDSFDYIIPMDSNNLDNLVVLGNAQTKAKTRLFMSYASENIRSKVIDVPDPYKGGMKGFEVVLNLIEYASKGLIDHIKQTNKT